jgi:hypothetical protein
MTGVRFPVGARSFSLHHHRLQTGSGNHPAPYTTGTGESFSGGKEAGVVNLTTHLHVVPKLRMHVAIPPLPHMIFS